MERQRKDHKDKRDCAIFNTDSEDARRFEKMKPFYFLPFFMLLIMNSVPTCASIRSAANELWMRGGLRSQMLRRMNYAKSRRVRYSQCAIASIAWAAQVPPHGRVFTCHVPPRNKNYVIFTSIAAISFELGRQEEVDAGNARISCTPEALFHCKR